MGEEQVPDDPHEEGSSSGDPAAPRKAAKRTAAKKAMAAKKTVKRSVAKKAVAKKTVKRSVAKKAVAKKTAKKTVAKKATKKAVAKRATARRPSAGTTAKRSTAASRTAKQAVSRLPDPGDVERTGIAAYPPGVPATYAYPNVPLTRLLDDAAQDFPETVAVSFLGARLTYRRLLDQVDRFAAALRDLGVRKGDRVVLVLPNCPQHVVAIFAVLRLGAVVAEVDQQAGEVELEATLNDAGAATVVCLDPVYPRLAKLKGKLPSVRHIIATGIQDALGFPKDLLFALRGRRDGTFHRIPAAEGVLRMSALVDQSAPTAPQESIDAGEDLAFLLYTGGTAGASKGVMLTHANLIANAFQARLWMPDVQAGRENVLGVLPLHRAYGLTMCLLLGVLAAATLTLVPRFDTDVVLRAIAKHKPTLFQAVPSSYVALLDTPDVRKRDLSSIRAGLSVGGPLPAEAAARFEELTGGKLRECYGLTETSPLTHANPIYGKAKRDHIGLPLSDTVCSLADLDDPSRSAKPGEPGELAIHGPQVMRGYWQRPEETARVLRDGWLLTGDVARVDDEGYYQIVDRKQALVPGEARRREAFASADGLEGAQAPTSGEQE